jgi:hypothetical protein
MLEGPDESWQAPHELPEALLEDEDVLEAIPVDGNFGPSDASPSTTQDRLPFAYWSAQLRLGVTIQYGFVVLRPHYVAFVPTGGRSNVAGELAATAIGVTTIDLEELFKYRSYFALRKLFERIGIRRFDTFVRDEIERSSGIYWPWEDVSLSCEANPVLRRWDMLVFQQGNTVIRGIPPRKDRQFIQKVIRDKLGSKPLPTSHPYILWTMVAVIPTIIAAVGINASLGAGSGAEIAGLICASFIAVIAGAAWICTIRTYFRALCKSE